MLRHRRTPLNAHDPSPEYDELVTFLSELQLRDLSLENLCQHFQAMPASIAALATSLPTLATSLPALAGSLPALSLSLNLTSMARFGRKTRTTGKIRVFPATDFESEMDRRRRQWEWDEDSTDEEESEGEGVVVWANPAEEEWEEVGVQDREEREEDVWTQRARKEMKDKGKKKLEKGKGDDGFTCQILRGGVSMQDSLEDKDKRVNDTAVMKAEKLRRDKKWQAQRDAEYARLFRLGKGGPEAMSQSMVLDRGEEQDGDGVDKDDLYCHPAYGPRVSSATTRAWVDSQWPPPPLPPPRVANPPQYAKGFAQRHDPLRTEPWTKRVGTGT